MIVNKYFGRRYHAETYNCAHLVCDVFEELRGPEMAKALRGFLCAQNVRHANHCDLRAVKFLDKPVDPCVVLLQSTIRPPHVGVWLYGRVLHILAEGVQYQPLEVVSFGFQRIRFFTC